MEIKDLALEGIISFDGVTKNALKLHPNQKHILYPMGNKVAIRDIENGTQHFLTGHTNLISALSVSPCGKYVASGQISHLGFKASVIIWSFETKKEIDRHQFHKVRIEDICFSCESSYVISLGGKDDGNILVWDMKKKKAICGETASTDISGHTYRVINTNLREACFITAGENILKIWSIDPVSRKLAGFEIKVGKIKRRINTVVIDSKDEFIFCGTTSGDIIKARLNFSKDLKILEPVSSPVMVDCYSKISKDPKKRKNEIGELYSGGINAIMIVNNALIVGSGDGTVELVEILEENKKPQKQPKQPMKNKLASPIKPRISVLSHCNVFSSVSSIARVKNFILVGTVMCEMYKLSIPDFEITLWVTCHTHAIYDIAFPSNYSEVFATASQNDIRLWQLETQKELLRISVPNFICHSLCFSYDGTMIISAWNDGSIKTFTPQTGRLIFTITKAHLKAVTAVVIVRRGDKIISGGCDAQVRIWGIKPDIQHLITLLIEHAGPITHLNISNDDAYVISSSTDGTCILWDIGKQSRKQVFMAKTMFTCAKFTLNDAQILTCGSDRKIAYWESLDGSLVRELEGSSSDPLNCIDVTANWTNFVTGGGDFIVKFWDYSSGEVTHIGLGHAGAITACKISPDGRHIVTVSVDGTIMIWRCPSVLNVDIDDKTDNFKSGNEKSDTMSDRSVRSKANYENVDLSSRSNGNVQSVHKGDENSIPCAHDPSQLDQRVCSPKDNISVSSKRSMKSSTKSSEK